MNYYEHHIGDYAQATAHLSFVEDAALSRLMRWYYAEERPLPADIAAVQRIARARSAAEKKAVETVLLEFFELQDDGWHNRRCDEEISRYRAARDLARRKASKRWEKHAERERSDEKIPREQYRSDEKNQKDEISSMAKSLEKSKAGGMPQHPPGNAHHTPDTSIQNHLSEVTYSVHHRGLCTEPPTVVEPPPNATQQATAAYSDQPLQPTLQDEPPQSTRKGMLCRRLRAIGIDAAPHLAAWDELLPAYTDDDIILAAEAARQKRPNVRIHLNYLVPILRDRSPPPAIKTKFDPVEFVNKNRISRQDHASHVIDIADYPVARSASAA